MLRKNSYIKTIKNIIDINYSALRVPLALLDDNNVSYYCKPLCDENTWPIKNNYFCLEYYSFNQIKAPTLLIKEKEFFFGIIPLDYNLFITVGPIMNVRYTLSDLFRGLSDLYSEKEIVTYYLANNEAGHMENARFSNIFSLLSGAFLHKDFSPKDLYSNRIIINGSPFIFKNIESSNTNSQNDIDYLISKDMNSPFSMRCDHYIQNHLKEKITASDLSLALNISERTLFRLFKQNFNMSLNDYIHHMKINKSSEMLLETDMAISEISSLWGYSSQSHFTKTFEKIYNMTPGEYRKKHKKNGHT